MCGGERGRECEWEKECVSVFEKECLFVLVREWVRMGVCVGVSV